MREILAIGQESFSNCCASQNETLYSVILRVGALTLELVEKQSEERTEIAALRVLVIDDNLPYASGLAELLTLGGFETAYALTGEKGIETAYRMAADAVILDMNLPDINGFEVCRRLRRDPRTAHIAVLFHTTKGSVPGPRHEADGFLGFPIPMDQVHAMIRGCVEVRRLRYGR